MCCILGFSLQVLLTSFELLLKDCATLLPITWQYCIVDEAHRSVRLAPLAPVMQFCKQLTRSVLTAETAH